MNLISLFTVLFIQNICFICGVTFSRNRNIIGPLAVKKDFSGSEYLKPVVCSHYKQGPNLDLKDLVGVWLSVYTQPKTVACFTLSVRSTTELEREQNMMLYGNFSGRVDWSKCMLEVESIYNKHYLQGDGTPAGLLENIIIVEEDKMVKLQEENADQWRVFGRRGAELLLMRDCTGEAVAVFARAPYWPTSKDLYSILHRSGVQPSSQQQVMCEPIALSSSRHCYGNAYYYKRKP